MKYCVRACMRAFCLLVLSAEWHAGATLGRVGLCCVSTLSARPDGSCHRDRRWSNGKKSVRMGGLSCARVACPQSHHIWRPPAAGSPCSRCPHPFPSCSLSHFPDGGDVFQQAVICVRGLFGPSLLFAQEEQGGVDEGWRDGSSKVISYDTTDSYELWVILCGVRTFSALPLAVAAPDPERIVGEILPSVPACLPTLIVHSQQTHSFAFPFSYLAFFPCFVVPHPCIFPGPCSSTEIQAWEAKRRAGQQRTQEQRDSC